MLTCAHKTVDSSDCGIDNALNSCRACDFPDCSSWLMVEAEGMTQELLRCGACGSLTLKIKPDYETNQKLHSRETTYHGTDRKKFILFLEKMVGNFRRGRARWLRDHTPAGGEILDIGCGRALMGSVLAGWGYRVVVTEVHVDAAERALQDSRLDVRVGEHILESLDTSSFDSISMFHSLEHMDSPTETLREISRVLRPGGSVFIEVPFYSGLARYFGASWFHLDVPRHLVHFSEEGFVALTQGQKFKVVDRHSFSWEFSPVSLFLSISNRMFPRINFYEEMKITNPNRWSRYFFTMVTGLGSGVCLFPSMILAYCGVGDILRVRLIKDDMGEVT